MTAHVVINQTTMYHMITTTTAPYAVLHVSKYSYTFSKVNKIIGIFLVLLTKINKMLCSMKHEIFHWMVTVSFILYTRYSVVVSMLLGDSLEGGLAHDCMVVGFLSTCTSVI